MNKTIEKQLNHRSIRKFKDQPLPPEIVATLVDVARHTSTSSFMQKMTLISITDPIKKLQISEVSNQKYVAECGHLFVFVIDNFRNNQIAREEGIDTHLNQTASHFLSGFSDALLACQNVLLAAESLDLGGVILGSILNDTERLIDILELPKYTFPIIGLALGYPDQEPQLKPRLPQELMHFENTYQVLDNYHEALAEYDETVTEYYDLRDANTRIDTFTNQVEKSFKSIPSKRSLIKDSLNKQGFINK